jgi:hypothetical protein
MRAAAQVLGWGVAGAVCACSPATARGPDSTAAAAAAAPVDEDAVYRRVVEGMSCKQQPNGQLDCEYRVGRSLWFAIPAVGRYDAAVTVFRADWDGDYYLTYGELHGCAIVKAGKTRPEEERLQFAFVSPKDGKVYRDWPSCKRNSFVPDR